MFNLICWRIMTVRFSPFCKVSCDLVSEWYRIICGGPWNKMETKIRNVKHKTNFHSFIDCICTLGSGNVLEDWVFERKMFVFKAIYYCIWEKQFQTEIFLVFNTTSAIRCQVTIKSDVSVLTKWNNITMKRRRQKAMSILLNTNMFDKNSKYSFYLSNFIQVQSNMFLAANRIIIYHVLSII